ncbi:transaldolase family protein [Streptomyces sp. NPDC002054]|uniref:transaldolase family protein n=1 Tax=Streptomyces sp. NPDC002054 TaxID=3154663 RepID=UPI0033197AFF
MMSQPAMALLKQLAAEGVSPWLAASNADLMPGALYRPAEAALLHGAVATDADPDTARRTCDTLWDTYLASEGRHGRVSVPVDPRVAHDAQAMVADARSVHAEVGRPNLLLRIPATEAGLLALEECVALGIGVDADLVFSVERYDQVIGAYLNGLERALTAGRPLDGIAAVASVPVGLLDAEVNARLSALPSRSGPAVRAQDTAAVALARQIYRLREERLSGEWWRVLRAAGALPPGLLWTAVRPRHISELVGTNTAHAASLEVLESAATQVELRGDTLLNAHIEGRRALDILETLGVRMADVADVLETVELNRLQHAWVLRS